jgi:hypothetical protein
MHSNVTFFIQHTQKKSGDIWLKKTEENGSECLEFKVAEKVN